MSPEARAAARTGPSDVARRIMAVGLGILYIFIFVVAVRWFAHLVTDTFSSFGYAIVPLGIFIVIVFELPLMSATHKLWVSGDAEAREETRAQTERHEALARLSSARVAPKNKGEAKRREETG